MTAIALIILAAIGLSLLLVGGWGYTEGRDSEACCARCMYPTVGLVGEVCPECGGDLRGRGTRPAGSRVLVRPGRGVAIVCRTVLVGVVAAPVLVTMIGNGEVVVSSATAQAKSGGGLFSSFTVSGRGSARGQYQHHAASPRVVRVPATAWLVGPKRTVKLVVLDVGGRVRYDGPDGRVSPADGVSPEHVLRWMAAAGVDATSERASLEAAALHTLMWNVVASGGSLKERVPGGGLAGLTSVVLDADSYRRASWWWLGPMIGVTAVVWAWLVLDVLRWGRRGEGARGG